MTSDTTQAVHSRSLVSPNLALLLCGAGGLLIVSWFILQPSIDAHWFRTAALLQFAALAGLALRGLRRKTFFGGALSLHQSLSFEVVIQMLQAVSPLMPRRAFETEFMTRETALPADQTGAWMLSRKAAMPFIMLASCVALLLLQGFYSQAAVLALLAAAAHAAERIQQSSRGQQQHDAGLPVQALQQQQGDAGGEHDERHGGLAAEHPGAGLVGGQAGLTRHELFLEGASWHQRTDGLQHLGNDLKGQRLVQRQGLAKKGLAAQAAQHKPGECRELQQERRAVPLRVDVRLQDKPADDQQAARASEQ